MPWTYAQQTGALGNPAGAVIGNGYSGREAGLDNPAMQDVQDIGPIPVGTWSIGPAFTHALGGPVTMRLMPIAGTNTLGRDGFMTHGDTAVHAANPTPDNSASHGCVVLARNLRDQIAASDDRSLIVTA